jgi:glycosyltransferase involved in cell wall biosynthesis
MNKLSVVLATYNEENNIKDCLESVKNLADEIVIIDGGSLDKTREIAQKMGAIVVKTSNPIQFHINKQKGVDEAKGEWILQLDADERVSPELEQEIKNLLKQENIQENGFAIPRRNWFLGKFLQKGGAYPDPVVRLFKKSRGKFNHQQIIDNQITTSNVHAQIEVESQLGILSKDLIHYGDKDFERYLQRLNRYTQLEAENLTKLGLRPSFWRCINYVFFKPFYWFFIRYFRHLGFKDGLQGFLWALLSALHYPIIYFKVWEKRK